MTFSHNRRPVSRLMMIQDSANNFARLVETSRNKLDFREQKETRERKIKKKYPRPINIFAVSFKLAHALIISYQLETQKYKSEICFDIVRLN